ncbi:MAG TPA: error-prone DNA polymerase [Gemmatimonadaceae bacterium]|nr:error-prone DNA polymerase [Gemmatimonadaceae bacterium]
MTDYVELHCHSAFSLLDGASTPETLVEHARTLGMPALALTDHDDLGGAVRFAQAGEAIGIATITGAELTVRIADTPTHLVLLAESAQGYSNISTLITRARMDAPRGFPSVPLDVVAEHATGILALTGCPRGWVPSRVAAGDLDGARTALGRLIEIFGRDHLAVECWNHHRPDEHALVATLIPLAHWAGVPWVVTNDVHYATPNARMVHDVLSCLRHNTTLDAMGTRLRPNSEWHLKDAATMRRLWGDTPQGLRATLQLAEQCTFRLGKLEPTLPAFTPPDGSHPDEYLAAQVETGATTRWGPTRTDAQRRQLVYELAIIKKLRLAGFFLIVWDIMQFARREGILAQGRGSAANSAVCYCLGITAIDPIKMGLMFERFMSDGRDEAPDIDLDFAHRERERVIQYIYTKYGRAHAAMVCEQITYRRRSAIRDAARVLGFSVEQASTLSALSDHFSTDNKPDVTQAGLDPADHRVQRLTEIVDGLHQLPRHRSIHVGGFILTAAPVSTVVPVEPASMPDRTVIQWERDDLDAVHLVKIDVLGLGMLTLLQDCIAYIAHTRGITIDLAQLEMNDPAVYASVSRADTIGVFQIESRAQMATLPRLRPKTFYDLVIEVAIIRPGPIQGDMVHPYLRRRAGVEKVEYPHPKLEPILARTLGVPLFQEQGMQVAVACAGFSPAEADALRRAMGHKRSREKMAAIREKLVGGMIQNGIAPDLAERIYNQINGFADYGFPESHAASFALLVYASAYLRYYYAPEFLAAILNAQPMGFYAPGTLIEDARRHGVVVRPIDLTCSAWDCTLESDTCDAPAVRLGLRLVRGLGATARAHLEHARTEGGPFLSISDVVTRVPIDRRAMRHLAEAGAFDAMLPNAPTRHARRRALWRVLEAQRGTGGPLVVHHPANEPLSLPGMSPAELTAADYRTTGFSLNGHPLHHLRAILHRHGVRSASDIIAHAKDGDRVAAAGLVICRQRPGTAKGFVFLTLEDETGMVNIVVTPRRFARDAALITRSPLLVVHGVLQVEQHVIHLRGDRFTPLDDTVGADHAQRHDFH